MTIKLTDRHQVGATSLELPPMGFGAAHLGGMYHRVSGETAHATLKAAWDGGVRYFDTAPFYGRGLSEHRVGDFLIDQPRDEFMLTTKVGRYFRRPADPKTFDRTPWGGGLNMEIVWDYSYDGVMRSYEQSLLRLGLDSVDALLIHDPEASLAGDANGPRMEDMVEQRHQGTRRAQARPARSRPSAWGSMRPTSLTTFAPQVPLDFCIVAMPYTLLDQSALHTGLKRCIDNDISVIIGAPYASGILATGPGPNARYRYGIAPDDIQDKTRRIQSHLRGAWRIAAGGGAAVSAGPSGGGVGDPRRRQAGGSDEQYRLSAGSDAGGVVGRPQVRRPDRRRGTNAELGSRPQPRRQR